MTDTIPYLTTRPTRDTGSRILGRDANGHKCLFFNIPYQTEPIPLGNEAYFRGYFEASLVTQGTASPDVASVVKFKCKSLDGEPLLIPGNLLSVYLCNSGTFADSTNGLLTAANGSVAKRTIVSTKALVVSAADTAVATLATAQGSNQDVTLTAVDAGVDGNSISYTYQVGAASGALACAVTGTDIVVTGAMTAGTAQVESATVVAPSGATANGTLRVVLTGAAAGFTSPQTVYVNLLSATHTTATLVATAIKSALNIAAITDYYTIGGSAADITITANVKAANDATLSLAWNDGEVAGVNQATSAGVYQRETATVLADNAVPQVETATVVSAAGPTEDGILTVAVTAGAGTLNGTTYVPVALLNSDADADAVAVKIRAALGVAPITTYYTVGGTGAEITLTAITKAANDTSLAIAFDSAVAGVAQASSSGVCQVETATVVSAAGPTESDDLHITVTIAGVATNITCAIADADADAEAVAVKIRTAMDLPAITNTHTVGGSAGTVTLTSKTYALNDSTLNIAWDAGVNGVDAVVSSVNTTAGARIANLTAGSVGTCTGGTLAVVLTVGGVTDSAQNVVVTNGHSPTQVAAALAAGLTKTGFGFTSSGAELRMTSTSYLANDSTLNIAWAGAAGITAVTTSTNSVLGARTQNLTAGVAPALSSTASQIAAIINGTAAAALLVTAEATPGNGSGTAAAVTHTHLTGGGTGAQDEFIVAVNDTTAESVTLRIGPPPMGGKMQGLWDETFDLTHA